jgi:predicted transcriptional regulator
MLLPQLNQLTGSWELLGVTNQFSQESSMCSTYDHNPLALCSTPLTSLQRPNYTGFMPIHLSPELESKLAEVAAKQGREPNALLAEAVQQLVSYDEWFRVQVQKGLDDAAAGRMLSHEEVGLRVAQFGAKHQQQS